MSNVLQRGLDAYERGEFDSAERLFAETVAVAKHNLAVLAERCGDNAKAIRLFGEALQADPAQDETAHSLALALLRDGRYAEAWPLHERRRALARVGMPRPKPHWPEWTGEDLAGMRIAVLAEQGFGDQIMFARFLPQLRARGAEVTLVCAPELTRLLGGKATITRGELDVWRHLQSLPLLLGTTLETLPPPAALPIAWRGGGGVGVMVAGNPLSTKHALRTPPAEVQAQLRALGRDLDPQATGARDFLETAEIVAGLDVVVTIDTAMAHLAGSMGAPTWILLPAVDADWRWLRARTDSPWYASARLFRQPAPGDWAGAVEAVRAALSAQGLRA